MKSLITRQNFKGGNLCAKTKTKLRSCGVAALVAALLFFQGCFSAHKNTEALSITENFDQDGRLTSRITARDRNKGGGVSILTDPKASQINSTFTNQTNLGGGSSMSVGNITSTVSTNGIKATGSAAGRVMNSAITGK